MTSSAVSYVVRRAFRVPRDGGLHKPFRYYEVGCVLTNEDLKIWGEDHDINALVAEGFVEAKPSHITPPVVGDISEVVANWTRSKE